MSNVRHRCIRCARRRREQFLRRHDGQAWVCATGRIACHLRARESAP